MKKITVKLTPAGQEAYRSNQISRLGSDQALAGFNSLLKLKHAIQTETTAEHYQTVETNELYLGKSGTMKQRVALALGLRAKNADKLIGSFEVVA